MKHLKGRLTADDIVNRAEKKKEEGMRIFIGHKLIGGFFVGASFRPRLHPDLTPHPSPFVSWAVLVGFAIAVWEVLHWVVK